MQSKITTTCRAFLMLACIVGIMAAAMRGASWSAIVKKYKNIDWPPAIERVYALIAPSWVESDRPSLSASTLPLPRMAESPSEHSVSHDSTLPVAQFALSSPPQTGQAQIRQTPADRTQSDQSQADQSDCRDVQDRLQSLGATYYLLETWGNRQELYRFQCRIAIGKDANFTRYFEAVGDDPLGAMLQVLRQVEDWRLHEGLSTCPVAAG